MRSACRVMFATLALALVMPVQAYAADGSANVVPDWLSIAAGAVGLSIAVMLMIDAVLLRRVAEGSYVADNIAYMMSGVVCFAASMLARWVALFAPEAAVAGQMTWAADLLVTVGMALLAVYFMRVRLAMTRYLKAVSEVYASVAVPAEDEDAGTTPSPSDDTAKDAASGEEIGG